MPWEKILNAREVWQGKRKSSIQWPASGIAIEGDFAGIQQFVLKPVPGAKGAAKRLRGRSLQVSALTELIAKETCATFDGGTVFYSAGGQFLIFAAAKEDWPQRLAHLQKLLDEWIGRQFRGEVVFHLAGATFADGQIPRAALREMMDGRKNRSLEHFLQNEGGWSETNFLRKPGEQPFCCPACLTTANDGVVQPDEEDERICGECNRDKALGANLARLAERREVLIDESDEGEIEFLGKSYAIRNSGLPVHVIHHMPQESKEVMDLEKLAEQCKGTRKFLAYLRIDADGIGKAFRDLEDDASKVLGLSNLLQFFFCDQVQELIEKGGEGRYKYLYPVYGGGDDLFVIGPWDVTIDFAKDLAAEFTKATGGGLHFSAGVSLAKHKQHILTKSEEAAIALNEYAKRRDGKAAIRVFGETFSWQEFPGVLKSAENFTKWRDEKLISSQFLQMLAGLHKEWRAGMAEKNEAKQVRHRPMVHYQMERNLTEPKQKPVKDWLIKMLKREAKDPEASWASIGFVARYAMLASQKEEEAE